MGSWTFERALIRALSASPEKFVFSFSDQDPFSWQLSGNDLNLPALCIGKLLTKDYLAFLDPKNNSSDSNFSANIYVQNALTPTFQEWLTLHSRPEDPLIIIGNPPYAVSSSNKDAWIIDLMKTYAVSEPNLTRLYDDYVKFIRYGQWLLEQRSVGILAFITNRKYLDGKIFMACAILFCKVSMHFTLSIYSAIVEMSSKKIPIKISLVSKRGSQSYSL